MLQAAVLFAHKAKVKACTCNCGPGSRKEIHSLMDNSRANSSRAFFHATCLNGATKPHCGQDNSCPMQVADWALFIHYF